jgi:hypothetical protein
MKAIEKLLSKVSHQTEDRDLILAFNNIIIDKVSGAGYDGTPKQQLKSFLNDLQHGGCISGMINEFIYHSDCKAFYITHIDALEDLKTELEGQIGEPISNRHNTPHYTFMCWLCFEEYCFNIYRELFEN